MFVGVQDYSSRGYRFPREMGESPAEYARAAERHDAAKKGGFPREMGESPEEYGKALANYKGDTYQSAPVGNKNFPREVGESPEEYGRAREAANPQTRPMTEQEKVLDLYA